MSFFVRALLKQIKRKNIIKKRNFHNSKQMEKSFINSGFSTIISAIRDSKNIKIVFITLMLCGAKFILISNNEIVSMPNDSWAYLKIAGGGPWYACGGVSPGYPTWLELSMDFGVPQRIAIELLFQVSSVVYAFAIGYLLFGLTGYALILAFIVFSPVSYFLFDLALADGFYLCLTLLAVGFSVISATTEKRKRRWLSLFLMGFTLGMAAITRKEMPLILAGILIWGAASISYNVIGRNFSLKTACIEALQRLTCVAFIVLIMVNGVTFKHWLSDDVWALSLVEVPEHKKLLSNLAAIKTDEPAQRYVTISKKARMAAYANSPTLRGFQDIIEDPDNMYQKVSKNFLGTEGEIGGGWIWHIFTAALDGKGIRKPLQIENTYKQINNEIEKAFKEGKLKRDFVIHPLLGADHGIWVPYIWNGFSHTMATMIKAYGRQHDNNYDPMLFDRICLRRTALIKYNRSSITGWAFAIPNEIEQILIEISSGKGKKTEFLKASFHNRQDVAEGYSGYNISIPLENGFAANFYSATQTVMRMIFFLKDGTYSVIDNLRTGQVLNVKTNGGSNKISYAIDGIIQESAISRPQRIQMRLVNMYSYKIWWLIIFSLIFLGVANFTLHSILGAKKAVAGLIVAAVIICWSICRIFFYTLVDAAAWSVEPRYLQIAGLLLYSVAIMGIVGFIKFGIPRRITHRGFNQH